MVDHTIYLALLKASCGPKIFIFKILSLPLPAAAAHQLPAASCQQSAQGVLYFSTSNTRSLFVVRCSLCEEEERRYFYDAR
jgi:hypothetical protein